MSIDRRSGSRRGVFCEVHVMSIDKRSGNSRGVFV
jgi:hypothetical protein